MNCHSHNAHTGDAIFALNMLSRLTGEHVLCCNPDYHEGLRGLVEGLPIEIRDCSRIAPNSMDFWLASGLFERIGIRYQDDIDIIGFIRRYFNSMAYEGGHEPPFKIRGDMLCNFPAIKKLSEIGEPFTGIMVINANPLSGQCPRYSASEMDELIRKLEDKTPSVLAIEKADLSLVQIAALSVHAKLIIGCATGPFWGACNFWNATTQRIVMLDPMKLDMWPVPVVHAPDAKRVEEILTGMGYL